MASERVSKAIIDLVADPSGLKAGLAEGKKDVVSLGASVSALAKSISGDFSSSSDAARKFGADVKAAVTGAETSSKGLGTALSKVVGTDTIERANAYARAVTAIGGVSKLTTTNQEALSKALDSAARQYAAIGVSAPKSLTDLATSAKSALAATSALEKEGAAVQQQFARFSGKNVIQDANAIAAAVKQLGGASKLTAADQAAANRTLQDALSYYKAIGQQGPAALVSLEKETRKVEQATSLWKSALSTAIGTFSGFLSAQAVMSALRSTFGFVKDAVFGVNSTLETSTLQFTTLMGSADDARQHVLELFDFAKRTPFETGPVIEASRLLRVFGGAALDTTKNLTLIGDASATASAPINELGFWVGRLYGNLKGGQPFGDAAMRLQELAVMSPEVRSQMEALQKAGKSADDVFSVFQGHLETFSGAMERQAGTWSGVTSTFTDTVNMLMADALRPLFETTRDGLRMINDILGSPVFDTSSKRVADSIKKAFGGDSQATIKGTANGLLTVADSAILTADVTGRAWSALALTFAFVGGNISGTLATIAEMNARVAESAAALPVVGAQYRDQAAKARDLAEWLKGVTQSYTDQTREALAGVKGNDAYTTVLGAARQSIADMRTELGKATSSTAANTAATKDGATAAGSAAAAQGTYAQQLAAARVQIETLKTEAPEAFRDLLAAVKSGNVSIGDMSKQYKVAELAVKLLQDQIQGTKKGQTEAAAEAKKLETAQKNYAAASVELTDTQKAQVLEAERLNQSHEETARRLGITVAQITLYLEVVKDATAADIFWAQTHEEWGRKTRDLNAKWFDAFMKEQREQADASTASLAKQFTDREQYQTRVALLGLTGTRLKLAQINQEEAAEVKSLGERTVWNARYYDENRALIQQFYDYQRRQATSIWAAVVPEVSRTLESISQSVSSNFGQMLTGAESFGDGFISIWQSIKSSLANIFSEIADAFIKNAIQRMVASWAGMSLAGGASGGSGGWGSIAQSALGSGSSTATNAGGRYLMNLGGAGAGAAGTGVSMAGAAGGAGGGLVGSGDATIISSGGGSGAGLATAALGYGAVAGGGIGAGMLGKYLTGGAGQKAGAIGAAGGAATGALIGTYVFPGVGTLAGAGIGALAGYLSGVIGKSKTQKENEAANKDLDATRTGLLAGFRAAPDEKESVTVSRISSIDRAIGTQIAAGWDSAGKKGAEQWAPEVQRFSDRLKAYQDAGISLDSLVTIGAPEGTVEERLKKIGGLIEQLGQTGGVASKDLLRLRDSLEGTDQVKAFKTQQSAGAAAGVGDYLANAKVTDQGTASAIGDTLQGSFATMVAQGMSVRDVFAALKPQVDAFNLQLGETGLTGGASFGTLASMAGIVGNEISGKALTAISGLSGALAGAQNAGFLTQSMFTSLTGEILKQREAILATGATREDVDALTQKDLQTIWVLQHDNNYEVDAGTQALLDQAEASGTVGDKYRSAMDRAAIAMEKVAAALDIALGKTKDVGKAIDSIPSRKTITVDVDTSGVGTAFDQFARDGTDAADDVYDGVNAVSYGHSPGGIKQIPIELDKAASAFDSFASDTARPLREVKQSIDGAASGTSNLGSALASMRVPPTFTTEVTTAVSGIGSLVGTTKTVVTEATSEVGVLRGSVGGLAVDTHTAGAAMAGAFSGAVVQGESVRSKVGEISSAVGDVAGALVDVPWEPWSETASRQSDIAQGSVDRVSRGAAALTIALNETPWLGWAGRGVSAVRLVTSEMDVLLGRIAQAATGLLALPSAGGASTGAGGTPTPQPGPVVVSSPSPSVPGPSRPGPIPGPNTYPRTPSPTRTGYPFFGSDTGAPLLSATPFVFASATADAAPALRSSVIQAASNGAEGPSTIQLDVTVTGEVISSTQRAQEIGVSLATELRRNGGLRDAWRTPIRTLAGSQP